MRVAARSAIGLSAVFPARGRMSHGVERIRQMSSPLVLRRGSCGLEIVRIVIAKQSDGRHRVRKMMIVRNVEWKEKARMAPLPAAEWKAGHVITDAMFEQVERFLSDRLTEPAPDP